MSRVVQRIKFESIIDVDYPIEKASVRTYDWLQEASKESPTVRKCPGIIDLLRTGYILRQPWTITVKDNIGTVEDKYKGVESILEGPVFEYKEMSFGFTEDFCKMSMPWRMYSDCKVLMMPVPYPDKELLRCYSGILNPTNEQLIDRHHNKITPLFKLYEKDCVIEAGTPLLQIIPLTEYETEMVLW